MKKLLVIVSLLVLTACGQEESSQSDGEPTQDSVAVKDQPAATKARVTGSNVIIRSDHTTDSPSAGVVAREGTKVDILDRYITANSSEVILKRDITLTADGTRLTVPSGKAMRILADRSDSVEASFSLKNYGRLEGIIAKDDIEAMSDQQWYKIRTREGITGWIYGQFIEEL